MGALANYERRYLYGPFFRLFSDTQDAGAVQAQIKSGEIWGRVPRWGISPTVQAYPGLLPRGTSGIEFLAFAEPDRPFGPRSHWSISGPYLTIDPSNAVARLSVAFIRVTQDLVK